MTALGTILAVCVVETQCDTKHEHPVKVLSDGSRVYAAGIGSGSQDTDTASRSGTFLSIACPQPVEGKFPCHGQVVLDLASDIWTANPEDVSDLERFGGRVDS